MLECKAGDNCAVTGSGFDGGADLLGFQENFGEPVIVEVAETGGVPEAVRCGEVDQDMLATVGQSLACGVQGFRGFTHRPPPCR